MSLRHLLRRHGGTLLIGLLVVGAEVEIIANSGLDHRPLLAVLALGWTLPLLARGRFPLAAPLLCVIMLTASSFVDPGIGKDGLAPIAAAIMAFFWLGFHNDRRRALSGGVFVFACAQVLNRQFAGTLHASDVIFTLILVGAPLATGQALRARDQRARVLAERALLFERERDERARAAAEQERTRIARELHDVVAHSLGVMTVQAGAARLVLNTNPQQAQAALLAVEDAGRSALGEMRRLLGVLHDDRSPLTILQPSLAGLDALVEQFRAAGLKVELDVQGRSAGIAPGVDLAAYRIVQEGLTNALKHGGVSSEPVTARVRVLYAEGAVEVAVEDDGPGPTNGDGAGHGLVGMRERAALYGGTLTAGPRPGRGFAVEARLPFREALS